MKYLRLAFAGAAAIAIAACSGQTQTPGNGILPSQDASHIAVSTELDSQALSGPHTLFAATIGSPSAVDAFSLPLQKTSSPAAGVDVDEPVPVAVEEDHLFVGSFSDGAVYKYNLPLAPGEAPEKLSVGLGGKPAFAHRRPMSGTAQDSLVNVGVPSGIAVGSNALYIAGAAPNGRNEVLAFATPIVPGEKPFATIPYGPIDFLAVATARDTLYVASTTQGTIKAFPLPLTTGEKPAYTIYIGQQSDAAIGVAVYGSLYVTNFSKGQVLVYRLPYSAGVAPIAIDLKLANHRENPLPYAIAVDSRHVFVDGMASNSIFQYKTPIIPNAKPTAIMPLSEPAGLAVWPRWTQ